jgi:hypothetical protein
MATRKHAVSAVRSGVYARESHDGYRHSIRVAGASLNRALRQTRNSRLGGLKPVHIRTLTCKTKVVRSETIVFKAMERRLKPPNEWLMAPIS